MTTDAPPGNGGGMFAPRPPQQETTHTGVVESIIIPIKRALFTCLGAGALLICVYGIIGCVWMNKRIDAWHTHWWEPWRDLLVRTGELAPVLIGVWLVLCLFVWLAYYAGNILQVFNEKWFPVLGSVDPAEYGLFPPIFGRRGREQPTTTQDLDVDEAERMWPVRVEIASPDGPQRRYVDFLIPEQYADNWQRFCGGLAKPETFFTPRFSRAGAKRYNIPWEVFRPIQVEFLARGLAVQEPSSNGSGPVKLRAIGRAICKAFATTPPPQF